MSSKVNINCCSSSLVLVITLVVVLVRLMAVVVWMLLLVWREVIHEHVWRHVEVWTLLHVVGRWLHTHVHWRRRHMSRVARHRRTTLMRKHLRLSNARNELAMIGWAMIRWRWHILVTTTVMRRHRVVRRMHPISLWDTIHWIVKAVRRRLELPLWHVLLHVRWWWHLRKLLLHLNLMRWLLILL